MFGYSAAVFVMNSKVSPAVIFVTALLVLSAGCHSGRDAAQVAARTNLAITAPDSLRADQAITLAFEATVSGAATPVKQAQVDWADGTAPESVAVEGGRLRLSHTYARSGTFVARLSAQASDGRSVRQDVRVEVSPRKIVFIQGINSESFCPNGADFAPRAPAWVGNFLATDAPLRARIDTTSGAFVYFSYSGRYCGGGDGTHGEFADYQGTDTCVGVSGSDGAAAKLKALIDRLAPSKVTVLAHSMGGVVTAYLAASEPQWAKEHIVSVVTFDSPMGGAPKLNLETMSLLAGVSGGCGRNTRSVRDLADTDNPVAVMASAAAHAVPFYNLDATDREGPAFGIREAVPSVSTHLDGERANWQVATTHTPIWNLPPVSAVHDVRQLVACALVAAETCDGATLAAPAAKNGP